MKIIIMLVILYASLFGRDDVEKHMSNLKIGSVKAETDIGARSSRLYFGADIVADSDAGSIGIGFDVVGIDGGGGRDTNANGNYTLGTQFIYAYNMKDLTSLPVNLKANIGYGVTQYYKSNYWGYQYGAALEAKLYKSLGLGLGYKKIDTDTELGKTDNYLVYFSFFF